MAETIQGLIERVIFHNLETGYCVLRVQLPGRVEAVTVVGQLPQATAGEVVEAAGDWVKDRNYGRQFKAAQLTTRPPHTLDGIRRYLASGLVKGIGETYADRIVDTFGEQTLDIIDSAPARLREVRGIGRKRIDIIRANWLEKKSLHRILAFLASHGIGPSRALRIYKTYGEHAIEMVRSNPYRLCDDIWGIGFRTADEIALKLGMPHDAPQRIDAALRHLLQDAATSAGHVALPQNLIATELAELTGASHDQLSSSLHRLRERQEIVIEDTDDGPLIYRFSLHAAEVAVARLLTALGQGTHPLPPIKLPQAIAWLEARLDFPLAPSQRAAIELWTRSKLMVLTGGPGTGKTTIITAILALAEAKQLQVALAAPTGRAAKRLAETTNRPAATIHRLLEFDPTSGGFLHHAARPLELDLLIVDESSMIDLPLMAALLEAVPPDAALLCVGDVDQLPSVGPGSVLRDLIDSRRLPVARLTEIHRQAESSHIVRAAHAVNHGHEPHTAPAHPGDFFIIEAEEPAAIIERTIHMIRDRIPARFQLHPVRDVQVLTPMNRTELGVKNLNDILQQTLNPRPSQDLVIKRSDTTFRPGDKVMQIRNNYAREVFNGDIGIVQHLDPAEHVIIVNFDGREVPYEADDLDELVLAYAVTIHKSQGSEYPAVIVPIHTQHFIMLQRNLLYTAITRGRKLVVLVGSRRAIQLAVQRADTARRYGRLRERLQAMNPRYA